METALALNIKTLSFPDTGETALRDIVFAVKKGEFIVLTGGAASGKSLLLHTMTGAAMKYEGGVLDGSVRLMGKDIMEIPLPAVCEDLGYMFQEPQNQIVSVTVEEEVAFGLSNMGCSGEEIAARSKESLSFTGLTGLEKRKTTGLSGGQAQRLVLAGVLALKTPILLLDQPAAELDRKGKLELYALIQKFHREEGVTVVMAADNGVDIASFADRVLEMEDGTVKKIYAGADYKAPKRRETRFVPVAQNAETVLCVDDVSFSYPGNVLGCEDISFQVNRGDFLAIMGVNGSGKTTLLKLMEGLRFPDRGKITLFGREMTKKSAYSLRSKIGFLFQNPDLQIFANTVQAETAFALKNLPLNEAEKKEKVRAVLDQVGLSGLEDYHPQRLSRSQRQKLAAASALVHDPEIVIADEPTAGLNEEDSALIMDILASFREAGGTVILVSHDPALVLSYADRMLLLHGHRLVGQYTRADFSKIAPSLLKGGGCDEAV